MKTIPPFLFRAAHAFYSNVDAPPERNITKEMQQTLQGFQKTSPGFFALESQYAPKYAALHSGITSGLRGADIADVWKYGPAGFAGFLRANPLLAGSLGKLYGRMTDTPILSMLNKQAEAGLASGGALSSADKRNADQQTRGAFAARGNVMGNQAIGAELLGRDAAVRQRQQAAQQLALNAQQANQGQNDFIGRASQIFSSTLSDPFQSILGRASGAGGGGQQIGTGARLFDPLNAYASDIYNTNYNAKASANIANAQSSNAQTSAIIGLVGSLLLSDKKLKKNVKRIGKAKSGAGIYKWQYKTPTSPTFVGPVAQDVKRVLPGAVSKTATGHLAVDMGKTDVPFFQVRKGTKSLGQLLAA